jgi:hypothetical protein
MNVEFDFDGSDVRIRRARRKAKKLTRGEDLIAHLRRHRPKGGLQMTTDEIMALTRGED